MAAPNIAAFAAEYAAEEFQTESNSADRSASETASEAADAAAHEKERRRRKHSRKPKVTPSEPPGNASDGSACDSDHAEYNTANSAVHDSKYTVNAAEQYSGYNVISAEHHSGYTVNAAAHDDGAQCKNPVRAFAGSQTGSADNSDSADSADISADGGRREKNDGLLRMAKDGNKQAADELIQSNLGLVRNIALRFRGRGTEYEDLVQIGTVGMLKAVKSFDFGYGTAFSTYAVPLIIGEIRRYLRDNGPIKISRSVKQNGVRLMREREAFTSEFGREPRISELAQRCGMSADEASEALEACADICSLSAPAGDDGSLTLEGTLQDPDDLIASAADRIALGEALRALPALKREIIFLRYYKNMSQQQTGERLGISQVKVSREEKKILQQLRAVL